MYFGSRIRSKTCDSRVPTKSTRSKWRVPGREVPEGLFSSLRCAVFSTWRSTIPTAYRSLGQPSVFTRVFLWCLLFPGRFLRKNAAWRHGSPSIPWAGGGGSSESQFHSVFPVVFVTSWPFPSQRSSLAFFASDRKLLGRSRGPLSSVSNRCICSMKTSPV